MASSLSFVEYVCEQLHGVGALRYRKMFGEYVVYVNEKPVFTVCDDTLYVRQHPALAALLATASCGAPYEGAKIHYILDVDDASLLRQVAQIIEPLVPYPKPRKRSAAGTAAAPIRAVADRTDEK